MTDNRSFWKSGLGGDIFGEYGTARKTWFDAANDTMMKHMLADYLSWHRKNLPLYDDFDKDLKTLRRLQMQKWMYVAGAFIFAGAVFNPNYTSRHAFYWRKFTPFVFATIGW